MPRHSALKRDYPHCIFCAGERPTTSVEHMPSRILFDAKQRPKGLEFPSCQKCQNSTRKEELAVAMFSRIYPDATTPAGRQEVRKIMRDAGRAFPKLLKEMEIDQLPILAELGATAHKLPAWNFVTCGGPIAREIIEKFALKLAVALHFEERKVSVPRGAGILVTHYTNYRALVDGMPIEFMDALGAEKTLVMGAKHASDTFSYQTSALEDEPTTLHMAYFRQSFALLMAVFPRFEDVPPDLLTDIRIH